jgi:hypothetical protein
VADSTTNVLIRYLTGDPAGPGGTATRPLPQADAPLLPDLILAEVAEVLESFCEAPGAQADATLSARTNLDRTPATSTPPHARVRPSARIHGTTGVSACRAKGFGL